METTAQTPTIPASLLAEVEAFAAENHRSAEDALREIVEQGLQSLRWDTRVEKESQRARELGLPANPPPHLAVTREQSRERIAQGMNSLREGKRHDGEAVMAEILGGLAEPVPVHNR